MGNWVIVPHTLAETKTPSATMIAAPPLFLCLAAVISRAWQRNDWLYTAIWGAAMLAITIIPGGRSLVGSRDQFDELSAFAPFVQTNFWIILQLIGFGVLLAVFAGGYLLLRKRKHKNGFGAGSARWLSSLRCFMHADMSMPLIASQNGTARSRCMRQ